MPQFSGPATYDADLAERARRDVEAEQEAAAARSRMYDDLGLEGGAEPSAAQGGEVAELERDLADVQAKFEAAREELFRAREEMRRASDESGRVALIARSQTAVLRESFKRKMQDKMTMVDDLVATVEEYEERLSAAGDPVEDSAAALFREQREALLPSKSALGPGEQASADEEIGDGQLAAEVQQLRAETMRLQGENEQLRKQRFDRETHDGPAPPAPPSSSGDGGGDGGGDGDGALEEMLREAKRALADKTAECDRLRTSGGGGGGGPGSDAEEVARLNELLSEARKTETKLLKKVDKYKERALAAATAAQTAASAASTAAAASDDQALQAAHAQTAALETEAASLREQVSELQDEVAARKRKNKERRAAEEEQRERMAEEMASELQSLEASKAEEIRRLKKANRRLTRSGGAAREGLGALQTALHAERRALRDLRREVSEQLAEGAAQLVADTQRQICGRIERHSSAMGDVVANYKREMRERKRLFNLVQELRGNIRVFCRVRPPTANEDAGDLCATFPDKGEIALVNDRDKRKTWEFDHVFDMDTQQEDVFREVEGLVTSVMDGYNVCLFAYGQTGAGKTHTMTGPENDRGVNHRALARLFAMADGRSTEFNDTITVSVLEIYNEQIQDLLAEEVGSQRLEVRAGPNGMHVPGLTTVEVANIDEVLELMALGEANRSTFGTDMNEHSSRSHSMLSVQVTSVNHVTGQTSRGKLHLVDLAGSERVSKSGAAGDRLREAQNINRSLSALGQVIAARASDQSHVPFRNSTLTYLLQDSLSNDSKTLMIVCVSPVVDNADESFCSLNFAAHARTVELGKASRHVQRDAGGSEDSPASARGRSRRNR